MKRLIIAVSMFAVTIVFCIAGGFIVADATEKLSTAFEQCSSKETDEKLYEEKVNKAVALWEEKKTIFHVLFSGSEFDELENNVDELKFFVKFSDFDNCREVCFLSSEFLKRINGGFSPGIRLVL